ncbi:MAG TPA: hypothetical protein VFU19_20375, partial [Iamia sp.]|nr:hypothetical protein [Iamia sp.]
MRTMRTTGASLLLVLALAAGACGSDDPEESSAPPATGSEDAVTDTLPTETPGGTVDVPPEAGSTPIADYVEGTSDL